MRPHMYGTPCLPGDNACSAGPTRLRRAQAPPLAALTGPTSQQQAQQVVCKHGCKLSGCAGSEAAAEEAARACMTDMARSRQPPAQSLPSSQAAAPPSLPATSSPAERGTGTSAASTATAAASAGEQAGTVLSACRGCNLCVTSCSILRRQHAMHLGLTRISLLPAACCLTASAVQGAAMCPAAPFWLLQHRLWHPTCRHLHASAVLRAPGSTRPAARHRLKQHARPVCACHAWACGVMTCLHALSL